MALVLDGSAGVSGVDGTASNPSYEGTDSNTGIFFPAADTVAIGTGGTEALRVNSSQSLLLNTTSAPAASAKMKIATSARTGAFFDLTATGGENWIIDSTNTTGSTDVLGIYANGATGLYLQDTGNVGIGYTSINTTLAVNGNALIGTGAWPTNDFGRSGSRFVNASSTEDGNLAIVNMQSGVAANRGGYLYLGARATTGVDGATFASVQGQRENATSGNYSSFLGFSTTSSTGVIGERMRIDSSGNVGIGTSSPSTYGKFVAYSSGGYGNITTDGHFESYQLLDVATAGARFRGGSSQGSLGRIDINQVTTGAKGGEIRFFTCPSGTNTETERARITSGGYFKASNSGAYFNASGEYHEFRSNSGNNLVTYLTHTSATQPYGTAIAFTAATPNNTTNYFLSCDDTTNTKLTIWSSGTVNNRTGTYAAFSDIKLKQDIVDASSQWDDIKALRFRKYRFKDDPNGSLQLGLISQEAELVSPGLVFETPDTSIDKEGNRVETGEVTKSIKYSILYMKAVKALQEAMTRIEALEAEVQALKGNA
jgi:hypothetical protein